VSESPVEAKKLCITVLLSASVLMISFSKIKLNESIVGIDMIIVALFWLLDAQYYYYQEKIRIKMKQIEKQWISIN
jgi:uncharacterized membrane protein